MDDFHASAIKCQDSILLCIFESITAAFEVLYLLFVFGLQLLVVEGGELTQLYLFVLHFWLNLAALCLVLLRGRREEIDVESMLSYGDVTGLKPLLLDGRMFFDL